MTPEPRYINEEELAKIVGRAVQTLRNDRHVGRGIPYHKLGRSIRYFLPEVFEFMESKRVVPFREEVAR